MLLALHSASAHWQNHQGGLKLAMMFGRGAMEAVTVDAADAPLALLVWREHWSVVTARAAAVV